MPQNQINVGIGLKDRLTADLKRVTSRMQVFRTKTINAFKSIGRAVFNVKTLIAGLVAGAAVRGFVRMIKSVAELNDKFAKLGRRLGVTTETLSVLKFAGEQSGVTFESVSKALEVATKRLEEFRVKGTGEGADAMKLLGEEFRNLVMSGATLESLLPVIADKMAGITSESRRALISYSLFGRSGIAVGNQLLAAGSKELEEFRRQAERLGIILRSDAAKESEEFNDALNRLSKALDGLRRRVIEPLLPPLTDFVDLLTDLAVNNREEILGFFKSMAGFFREIAVATLTLAQGYLSLKFVIAKIRENIGESLIFKLLGKPKEAANEVKELRNSLESLRKLFEQLQLGPGIKLPPGRKPGADAALDALRREVAGIPLQPQLTLPKADQYSPISQATLDRMDALRERARVVAEIFDQIGRSITYNISGAIANMALDFKNAKEIMVSALRSIIREIIAMTARMLIFKAVSAGFGLFGQGGNAGTITGAQIRQNIPFYYGPPAIR
jgi:hypothetical protein